MEPSEAGDPPVQATLQTEQDSSSVIKRLNQPHLEETENQNQPSESGPKEVDEKDKLSEKQLVPVSDNDSQAEKDDTNDHKTDGDRVDENVCNEGLAKETTEVVDSLPMPKRAETPNSGHSPGQADTPNSSDSASDIDNHKSRSPPTENVQKDSMQLSPQISSPVSQYKDADSDKNPVARDGTSETLDEKDSIAPKCTEQVLTHCPEESSVQGKQSQQLVVDDSKGKDDNPRSSMADEMIPNQVDESTVKDGVKSSSNSGSQKDGLLLTNSLDSDDIHPDGSKQKSLTELVPRPKSSSGRVSAAELNALQSSFLDPPLSRPNHRKASSAIPRSTQKDIYCWNCHEPGVQFSCADCARSFHIGCLNSNQTTSVHNAARQRVSSGTPYIDALNWTCPECTATSDALRKMASGRHVLSHITSTDELNELLGYAYSTIEGYTDNRFLKPVEKDELPDYYETIRYPMDMSTIKQKIANKEYTCTEAFISDIKWIGHNSWVFNEKAHTLTKNAQYMLKVARSEMSEIEICHDCFRNYFKHGGEKGTGFVEPCSRPHLLVWARLKGYPYWPAKVMRIDERGQADTRFFGAHDKAKVPLDSIFIMSEEYPWAKPRSNKGKFDEAMDELEKHLIKLKAAHPNIFYYAPPKTILNPSIVNYGVNLPLSGVNTTLPRSSTSGSSTPVTPSAGTVSGLRKRTRDSSESTSRGARIGSSSEDEEDEDERQLQIDLDYSAGSTRKRTNTSTSSQGSKMRQAAPSKSGSASASSTPNTTPARSNHSGRKSTTSKKGSSSGSGTPNTSYNVRGPGGRFISRSSTGALPTAGPGQTVTKVITVVVNTNDLRQRAALPPRQNSTSSSSSVNNSSNNNTSSGSLNNPASRSPPKKMDLNKLRDNPSTISLQRKISERLGLASGSMPPATSSDTVVKQDVTTPPSRSPRKSPSKSPSKTIVATSANNKDAASDNSVIASVKKVIAKRKSVDSQAESYSSLSPSHALSPRHQPSSSCEKVAGLAQARPLTGERRLSEGNGRSILLNSAPTSPSSLVVSSNGTSTSTTATSSLSAFSSAISARQPPKRRRSIPTMDISSNNLLHNNNNNSRTGAADSQVLEHLHSENDKMRNTIRDLRRNHADEISRLQRHHANELDAVRQERNATIEALNRKHNSILEQAAREHQGTLAKIRAEAAEELKRRIADTKLKQWCAYCRKEASLYCCWNTSYCGYDCQHAHWPAHMRSCQQHQAQQAAAAAAVATAPTQPGY